MKSCYLIFVSTVLSAFVAYAQLPHLPRPLKPLSGKAQLSDYDGPIPEVKQINSNTFIINCPHWEHSTVLIRGESKNQIIDPPEDHNDLQLLISIAMNYVDHNNFVLFRQGCVDSRCEPIPPSDIFHFAMNFTGGETNLTLGTNLYSLIKLFRRKTRIGRNGKENHSTL